jgi:hypothetical protein
MSRTFWTTVATILMLVFLAWPAGAQQDPDQARRDQCHRDFVDCGIRCDLARGTDKSPAADGVEVGRSLKRNSVRVELRTQPALNSGVGLCGPGTTPPDPVAPAVGGLALCPASRSPKNAGPLCHATIAQS